MIKRLELPLIKEIEKLSVSQYYAATHCPYKLALACAFNFQQLMPISPNAYLGSILHKMLELIAKRVIQNEVHFEDYWRRLIDEKEASLRNAGSSAMVPLKYFCDDFALKKLKVRGLLKRQGTPSKSAGSQLKNRYAEEKLTNPENTVTGIVDLIIKNENGIIFLDFKTGAIYDGTLNENGEAAVKKDYEYQLKLYAYLYYLKTGILPDRLFIVTLENSYVEVAFTFEECKVLYQDAIVFLNNINQTLAKKNYASLANCSLDNCKFCAYRPACAFYDTWFETNFEDTKDLKGKLLKVNTFGNNTVGLEIELSGQKALVNGFDMATKEKLEMNIGHQLKIYNLRKSKNSINATANHYTTIYA